MQFDKSRKVPFLTSLMTGILLMLGLLSLVGYISAKEVTEMPSWPEYFQSGVRTPTIQAEEKIHPGQEEGNKTGQTNSCPVGNCDDHVQPPGLVTSTPVNNDPSPADQELMPIPDNLFSIPQNALPVGEPLPSFGKDKETVIPFSADPITREMENELIATGLLSRHAEITESIFLMEQQLKQAQLIIGLMEILGPDIPIEISPGEFKNFRDTPAGNKIFSTMAVETLESRAEILDLEMKVLTARKKIENAMNPLQSIVDRLPVKELESSDSMAEPEPKLREIIGGDGNLQAIFAIGDKIVSLTKGGKLPTGGVIIQITPEFVELDQAGQTIIFRIR